MQPSNFHYTNYFSDLDIFSDLFEGTTNVWEAISEIENFILNFKNSSFSKDFEQISENIFVGENVEIDKSAKIEGPAIICDNATIGDNVYLRAGVLIGPNSHVGHASEIKHSIILDTSAVAHLNYIGDSIIGSNVNFSGGAIAANWRFDKKEVSVRFKNTKITTGLEKFGTIVGDGGFIGVNSVLNPGTILGKNTLVFPLVMVKGVVGEGSVIKK